MEDLLLVIWVLKALLVIVATLNWDDTGSLNFFLYFFFKGPRIYDHLNNKNWSELMDHTECLNLFVAFFSFWVQERDFFLPWKLDCRIKAMENVNESFFPVAFSEKQKLKKRFFLVFRLGVYFICLTIYFEFSFILLVKFRSSFSTLYYLVIFTY